MLDPGGSIKFIAMQAMEIRLKELGLVCRS